MQLQKHEELIRDLMVGYHPRLSTISNLTLQYMQGVINLVRNDAKPFDPIPIAHRKFFQEGAEYTYAKVTQCMTQASNIRINKGELLQKILKLSNKLMQLEIDEIRAGRDEEIAQIIADLTADKKETNRADLKNNTRTFNEEQALNIARVATNTATYFTSGCRARVRQQSNQVAPPLPEVRYNDEKDHSMEGNNEGSYQSSLPPSPSINMSHASSSSSTPAASPSRPLQTPIPSPHLRNGVPFSPRPPRPPVVSPTTTVANMFNGLSTNSTWTTTGLTIDEDDTNKPTSNKPVLGHHNTPPAA